MRALLLAAAILGGGLASAIAWSMRPDVAYASEPVLAPRETQADVIRAAVFACVEAGGTWSQGVEDGVLLGRCYPLPSVGVVRVAKGGRQ